MTKEKAYKIASEFIQKHNPNMWDGKGEMDKDFSTDLETYYDIFEKDIYMVILFEIDADEGVWSHFVKLYSKLGDEFIDGYHGYGIDSVQNMVDTILDICNEYEIK